MVLLCWSSRGIGDAVDVELQMVLLGWSSRGIWDAVTVDDPTMFELEGRRGWAGWP